MGKSEFKKGRATPSAKTQRQPTCFHMFPCVIGTRRLKKNLLNLRSFAGSKGRGAELTIFTGSLLFVEFSGGAEVITCLVLAA